jgi:hypothetical protein
LHAQGLNWKELIVKYPQRILLTPLLIAMLALQVPLDAFADIPAPTPSPSPNIVQLPNEPFTVPNDANTPAAATVDHTQTWVLIGSAVVLGILLLTDHAGPGCNNDTSADDFTSDAKARRPAVGLTLHVLIP